MKYQFYVKNCKKLKALKNQLALFGLCPYEWVIKPQSKYKYIIQNIQSREFAFEGKTQFKNGTIRWEKINLYSL